MIPPNYKGREQAFIKHTLLEQYLERLFMIIGRYAKTICYIDCFAGPWQEGSPDLNDTSISISLNIINKCKYSLKTMSKDVKFRALFIENKKKSFDKLNSFLKSDNWSNIETSAIHGDFFDLRKYICEWCDDNSFAFFFIDPTGWKDVVEIETLKPLLQRKNSEYLINFMFYSILRTHRQPQFEVHMREIFGEIPNTKDMNPRECEQYLTNLYLTQLRNAQPNDHGKPRSAYVKVLYPLRNRTYYNLVYLTRHPYGIKVFMEESEKLDIIQKKVRAEAKHENRIEKSGQSELFSVDYSSIDSDKNDFDLDVVKEYWLQKLTLSPERFGIEELADMLEQTGWFISNFQLAFKELENEGKVKNCDSTRKRPKNVINFQANNNSGELLVRL
jgi:three-Cys-motif partner protein